MTTNNMLGSQLRIMLCGLSEQGIQHFTEIETDLMQTNLLLEEAIAKLVASFMAVNGSIYVQQEMLDSIISGQSVTSDNVAGMKAISDEIGRHINDAITGLQFQDMTRQLIERSLKRVIGMRGVLNALGSSGAGMSPDGGVEQIVPLLKSINWQLVMQNEKLKDVLWKTVRQKHMDSGDVELF